MDETTRVPALAPVRAVLIPVGLGLVGAVVGMGGFFVLGVLVWVFFAITAVPLGFLVATRIGRVRWRHPRWAHGAWMSGVWTVSGLFAILVNVGFVVWTDGSYTPGPPEFLAFWTWAPASAIVTTAFLAATTESLARTGSEPDRSAV